MSQSLIDRAAEAERLAVGADYDTAKALRAAARQFRDAAKRARADERERCAMLHESVRVNCDHEPGAGAGAMGAVIQYRDLIRAQQ